MALLVDLENTLEEVVVLSEFVLDFTDEVVSPLDHHVLSDGLMMRVLDTDEVLELSWES